MLVIKVVVIRLLFLLDHFESILVNFSQFLTPFLDISALSFNLCTVPHRLPVWPSTMIMTHTTLLQFLTAAFSCWWVTKTCITMLRRRELADLVKKKRTQRDEKRDDMKERLQLIQKSEDMALLTLTATEMLEVIWE